MLAMPLERIRIVYKALKPSGLGKGSHSGLQRLVGAISNCHTNDWSLYKGCHVSDTRKYSYSQGGGEYCPMSVLAMTHPFPSPLSAVGAGATPNFSPLFAEKGFAL